MPLLPMDVLYPTRTSPPKPREQLNTGGARTRNKCGKIQSSSPQTKSSSSNNQQQRRRTNQQERGRTNQRQRTRNNLQPKNSGSTNQPRRRLSSIQPRKTRNTTKLQEGRKRRKMERESKQMRTTHAKTGNEGSIGRRKRKGRNNKTTTLQ